MLLVILKDFVISFRLKRIGSLVNCQFQVYPKLIFWQSKAYNPLRRKIPGVWSWRWAMPPTPEFCVENTNMLVSCSQRESHNLGFYPKQNLKFAFYPTRNPNASQWNIGCIGSQRKILALAIYISFFLCRFHLRRVPNANPISSGIWA